MNDWTQGLTPHQQGVGALMQAHDPGLLERPEWRKAIIETAELLQWRGDDEKGRRALARNCYAVYEGHCSRAPGNGRLDGGLGTLLDLEIIDRFQEGEGGGPNGDSTERHNELRNLVQTQNLAQEVVGAVEVLRLEPFIVTGGPEGLADLIEDSCLHETLTRVSALALATGSCGAGVTGWERPDMEVGTEVIPAHDLIAQPMPSCPTKPGAIVRFVEGGYLYFDVRVPSLPICRRYEGSFTGDPLSQKPKASADLATYPFRKDGKPILPIQIYPHSLSTGALLPVAVQLFQSTIDLMIRRTRIEWIAWTVAQDTVVMLTKNGNPELVSGATSADPRPVVVVSRWDSETDEVLTLTNSADAVTKWMNLWREDWEQAARQYRGTIAAQKTAAESGIALTIREGALYRERARQERAARPRDTALIHALMSAQETKTGAVEGEVTPITIEYPVSMSAEDQRKAREEVIADIDAGRKTLIDLETFDHPNLSEEDAAARVIKRIRQGQVIKEVGGATKEYSAALASSLLLLVDAAKLGSVPRDGALGLMKAIYSLSDEVATKLLPPRDPVEPSPDEYTDEADSLKLVPDEETADAASDGLMLVRRLPREQRDTIPRHETDMARALSNRVDMSEGKVRELLSWHRMNVATAGAADGTVDAARYMLHGGSAGQAWATSVLAPTQSTPIVPDVPAQ